MSVGCNCLSGLRHCAEKNWGAGKWMHGQNLTQLWVSLWTQLTGELKEQWVQKFLRATSCQLQRFHKDHCTKFHANHTANRTTYVILVSSHTAQCMELFFTVWNGAPGPFFCLVFISLFLFFIYFIFYWLWHSFCIQSHAHDQTGSNAEVIWLHTPTFCFCFPLCLGVRHTVSVL